MGLLIIVGLLALTSALNLRPAQEKTNAIFSLSLPKGALKHLEHVLYEEVSNPRSAMYAKYLTNQEIAQITAASPLVVKSVTKQLARLGFTNIELTAHGDHIRAFGPVLSQLPRFVFEMHFEEDSARIVKKMGVTRRQALREKSLRQRRTPQDQQAGPEAQRDSYGIPSSQAASNGATGLVWGPGTYGYLASDLAEFYSEFNVNANVNDINTTGASGIPGGDNFGECTLDVSYITGIGNGVKLSVSNTNTTQSTEEGKGFGYAFLDFSLQLAEMQSMPGVVSLSLGSLSAYSCNTLCAKANSQHGIDLSECQSYLQQQRQVCMMDSMDQQAAIGVQLMKAGTKGTSIFAAAGDGGSHFSFVSFPDDRIGRVLNKVSCDYNFPTFPASHPAVTAVGGTQWQGGSPDAPVSWTSGGSGFSWQFSRPPYQKDVVDAYLAAQNGTNSFPPYGSFDAASRAYPDISAVASNIPMVEQGQTISEGGTSASSPEVAGIFALLNDLRAAKNLPPLGFINTRLYQKNGGGIFDVVSGNSMCNIQDCCSTGFPAATGWDAMSGWGSPVWSALVTAFGSDEQ